MGHIPTYSDPFSLAVLPSRAGLAWSPLLDRLLRHAEGYVWPILSPGPAQDLCVLGSVKTLKKVFSVPKTVLHNKSETVKVRL